MTLSLIERIAQQRFTPTSVADAVPTQAEETVVSEVVGGDQNGLRVRQLNNLYSSLRAYDDRQQDVRFYDRLTRGIAEGYELGGYSANLAARVDTAYAIGNGFTATLDAAVDERVSHTNELLKGFVQANLQLLVRLYYDHVRLGNIYAFMGVDGRMHVPPVHTVTIDWAEFGHRAVNSVSITLRQKGGTVTDTYYRTHRDVLTTPVSRMYQPSDGTPRQRFSNLFGILPFAHFAHDRSPDELYGRPQSAEAVRLFHRADVLEESMHYGVELTGKPIPVFKSQDPEQTRNNLATTAPQNYYDWDGDQVGRNTIDIDRDAALFVGVEGDVKFLMPPRGFTEDMTRVIDNLHKTALRRMGLYDVIVEQGLGKEEIATKMQAMLQQVRLRRMDFVGSPAHGLQEPTGIHRLLHLYLQAAAMRDPRVIVAPTSIHFPALDTLEAQTRLQAIIYADSTQRLSRQRGLELLSPMLGLPVSAETAVSEAMNDPNRPILDDVSYRNQLNGVARQQLDIKREAFGDQLPESPAGGLPGERRTRLTEMSQDEINGLRKRSVRDAINHLSQTHSVPAGQMRRAVKAIVGETNDMDRLIDVLSGGDAQQDYMTEYQIITGKAHYAA